MHYLYRLRGPGAPGQYAPLYIGITNHLTRRLEDHRTTRAWWLDVRSIDIQPFDHREEALDAERQAIYTERPIFNIVHNKSPRSPAPITCCPCCNRESIYDRAYDRYFHLDGTNNRECWAAISSGCAA